MKIFRLALVLLLLVTPLSRVQSQDVIYSAYDKFDFRDDDYDIVGVTGGRLFTYAHQSEGAQLNAYDDSMNKVATILLDFFPERIYKVKFIAYPDKIITLYQALESNKVIQYAALLDNLGRLVGKPVQLGSVKTGIFGATKVYFSAEVSENKKYILVYNASDHGRDIDFDGKWLDDKLNIVKRCKASYSADNAVSHGDLALSNEGTVFLPLFTTSGALNYADQFWILKLLPGASRFEARELPLGDKYGASGYLKMDNVNNRIYFGGFYSNKKNGGFDGIIFADYDVASGDFRNHKFIPFDNKLIDAAGARRKNHAFDNYEVKQLVVKNDGGFVLVSEVHYITTRSNYMPGFGYYSYYSQYMNTMVREYHFDDIMALSYNSDGTRIWSSFIPKFQYSQEDGGVFSSYALLNTGGTLAFLFNDFNVSRSRIQLATIDADGKTDIHSFTAEGNDNPDWLPRSGRQVSPRDLVIPCFHKRQICFAKVMF